VANAPGAVDSDYRGEICVLLANFGRKPFTVRRGDRIAQMVFVPVVQVAFVPVDQFSPSERGAGGFGHTGRH